MNKDQIEKYTKLGWEFTDDGQYFKSPRMQVSWWLDSIYKIEENKLLEMERNAILCEMRLEIKNQFDKIVDDIVNQQRLILEHNGQPEKLIKVSFNLNFK